MAAIVAIVVPAGRDVAGISRILAAADIACLVIAPDALVRGIATCDMDAALLTEASLPALRATDLSARWSASRPGPTCRSSCRRARDRCPPTTPP